MQSVLDRVPVDRITTEAREVQFLRTLLTVIAAVLWATGWAAGKVLGAVWLAAVWSVTAVKVGWSDARGGG